MHAPGVQRGISSTCEQINPHGSYQLADKVTGSATLSLCTLEPPERLQSTLKAIAIGLGSKGFHYRYSGMEEEEGCFLACRFWMIDAHAIQGRLEARAGRYRPGPLSRARAHA